MENRLKRLQEMEREYMKRIDETKRQAAIIKQNKERHQLEMSLKLKRDEQKRLSLEAEKEKNIQAAEQRRLNIQKQKDLIVKSNRARVQITHEQTQQLKDMHKKNEKMDLNRKIQMKIDIENKKLMAKRARQEHLINKLNVVKMAHHKEATLERELATVVTSRANNIEEEERKLLERLQAMEAIQQDAILELKDALLHWVKSVYRVFYVNKL